MPTFYASNHDWINNWPEGWTERSTAYRTGFQTGFRGQHRKPTCKSCPYRAGTEAFDAYYAGLDAGVLKDKVQKDIALEQKK